MKKSLSEPQLYHYNKDENVYRSCCYYIDRRAAKFFAQLVLTLLIVTFCFYEIVHEEKDNSGPMWALLGTFIGFWFETPRFPQGGRRI